MLLLQAAADHLGCLTLTMMPYSQAAAHGSIPRTLPDSWCTRSDHPLSLSLSCSLFNHALSTAYATFGRRLTSDREGGPSSPRTVFCGASSRALSPCAGWEGVFCSRILFAKACAKGCTPRRARTLP